MRKKILFPVFVPILFSFVFPLIVRAQLDLKEFGIKKFFPYFLDNFVAQTGYIDPTEGSKIRIEYVFVNVIHAALILLGMIFLSLIIYGGYLWLTAGGRSERVEAGRDWMQNAVIGMLIVLGGYVITFYIIRAVYLATQNPDAAIIY